VPPAVHWPSVAVADLSLGDLAANIVLRTVGVERDLRSVEHHQQFGLVGVQAREQPVERGEAGPALEDPVEAGAKRCLTPRRRIAAIDLEVGIEPPNQAAHPLLGGTMPVGEGIELMDQPLDMDPAEGVAADIELTRMGC
jgi:hypothetical protein